MTGEQGRTVAHRSEADKEVAREWIERFAQSMAGRDANGDGVLTPAEILGQDRSQFERALSFLEASGTPTEEHRQALQHITRTLGAMAGDSRPDLVAADPLPPSHEGNRRFIANHVNPAFLASHMRLDPKDFSAALQRAGIREMQTVTPQDVYTMAAPLYQRAVALSERERVRITAEGR